MKHRIVAVLGCWVFSSLCVAVAATPGLGGQRIYVDADVRISYDGDVTHMEAPIGASATDPDILYASAQLLVPGRGYAASPPQVYYSHDGGVNWSTVLLPGEISKIASWDSSIAGGRDGTAYFITRRAGKKLFVYRTNDGGETWVDAPTNTPKSWDRPYSVVDNTGGPNDGRLYIAGESHPSDAEGLHVMSSSDGGKTFSTPVLACKPKQDWSAATEPHPVVLSDGTLVVRCNFYPDNMQFRLGWHQAQFGVVVSSDGGKTFSPFRSAGLMEQQTPGARTTQFSQGELLVGGVVTAMAVAPKGARFADRLYIALGEVDGGGRQRVYLTHSDDRGVTWSKRRAIDPDGVLPAPTARQGLPLLAVNKDGVVGISWFDSRNVSGGKGYDIYFTASLDGGESFLPAQRVTSQPSHPRAGGTSIVPHFSVNFGEEFKKEEERRKYTTVSFSSPFNLRWTGGDFSTMVADAQGRFHPMWPDARSGTWQLYTSTIRVIPPLNAKAPPPCVKEKDLKMIMGEPRWNEAAAELSIPVQLQNVSTETLFAPMRLTLQAMDDVAAERWGPEVLAAFPAAQVVQEEFNYGISIDRPLFPKGVTEALIWRMHVIRPEAMLSTMKVTIQDGRDCCAEIRSWSCMVSVPAHGRW